MASSTYPPAQAKGILSLPDEILEMILEPLVRFTPERMEETMGLIPLKYWKRDNAFVYMQANAMRVDDPKDCLHINLLQVCKRFYQIGAPLVYASTLVIYSSTTNWQCEGCIIDGKRYETWYQQQQRRIALLARAQTYRFRKVNLFVETPDEYDEPSLAGDGEQLVFFCEALMAHQPVWDRIIIDLDDKPAMEAYGSLRACESRLLYEVGRLHGKEVQCIGVTDATVEDVLWAVHKPERTPLLWPLYTELIKYFDRYDEPVPKPDRHSEAENKSFREEARKAAEERDMDRFFTVLEAAVEYVKDVVSQELSRPDTVFEEAADGFFERVKEEGDRLVSARKRGWRAVFGVKGV